MRSAWKLKTARFFSLFLALLLTALVSQSIAYSSHQAVHIAQNLSLASAPSAHSAGPGDHSLRDENCAICAAFRTPGQAPDATTILTEHFDIRRLSLEIARIKLAQLFRLRPPSRAPPGAHAVRVSA